VEDWKNSTILNRVEEFVAVPACSQWASLALAISDDRQSNGLGVVEDSAECVRDRVSELTTLVDTANYLFRDSSAYTPCICARLVLEVKSRTP
jgi:hypothetical protein